MACAIPNARIHTKPESVTPFTANLLSAPDAHFYVVSILQRSIRIIQSTTDAREAVPVSAMTGALFATQNMPVTVGCGHAWYVLTIFLGQEKAVSPKFPWHA